MPILNITKDDISFSGQLTDRVIEIDTEASLQFFEHYSVRQPALAEDTLGMYSYLPIGRDLKARFAHMKRPNHILQKRKNGCAWNPKGRVETQINEFTTGAIEYNGEQCPDFVYDTIMERILGVGNQVRDLFATAEGTAIMNELIEKIYLGMGDSINNMAYWANHPLITSSNANNWYVGNTPADQWVDFVDQQNHSEVGGWMTVVDALKTAGNANFNVAIAAANAGTDGTYSGDPEDLFRLLKSTASGDFKVMLQQVSFSERPAFIVTEGIWNAYFDKLVNTYTAIPETYRLRVTGQDGIAATVPNVLMWQGHPVILNTQWGVFDSLTGVTHHRAILSAPGNFGLAFDTEAVRNAQYSGASMRLTQRVLPPFQGKVYMDTTFRMGTRS